MEQTDAMPAWEPSNRSLILNRIILLRAFALSSFALYVVAFANHPTSVLTILVLLACSGLFSYVFWLRSRSRKPLRSFHLLLQILWDGITTLTFVYMVGGSTNPFIYYLLVGVAISAGILREREAWPYCFMAIIAYSLLMYLDIGQHMVHLDEQFLSHLIGMWVNFVASAILICFFISRLAVALKSRERALSLAREEILKNEQLIGIGTLAASTVHSFGTPLSTIAMASTEIEALHPDKETLEYLSLIKSQIKRCKDTMQKLTLLANRKNSSKQHMQIATFVCELEEHFSLINAEPAPTFKRSQDSENLYLPGGMLLLHAIINLIENAITAAKSHVEVSFSKSSESIIIVVEDDGDGIAAEQRQNMGDAIITSHTGLGIGFLLANSTIERLGGSVQLSNPSANNPLTRVSIDIPLNNND